jgi:alpha-L-rhamnosidase
MTNTRSGRRISTGVAGFVLTCLGLVMARPLVAAAADAAPAVTTLRAEWFTNPLGIDERRPRLSWTSESPRRGTVQSAYQVLVASSLDRLRAGRGDLWDSGRIASDRSIQIAYGGPPLRSGQRAHWTVRVWDQDGRASTYAPPVWWEQGLDASEWAAKWIALPAPSVTPAQSLSLAEVQWIGAPPADGPESARQIRLFRRKVDIPADRQIVSAMLMAAADNAFLFRLNGEWTDACEGTAVALVDLREDLVPGENELGFTVQSGSFPFQTSSPSSLAARLRVEFDRGEPLIVSTDAQWETAPQDAPGRAAGSFAPPSWTAARPLRAFDEGLWNGKRYRVDTALRGGVPGPSPLLRKAFRLGKPIHSARAYVVALGLYELHLNGRRVGEDVLSPGWTDYTRRVQYQTYDVTALLRRGENAAGIVLGDGWYAGHIGWHHERAHYGPLPMARVEIHVLYADGTRERIVTDRSWKGAFGPIRSSDLLKGESYDARREQAGWDRAGFAESGWTAAAEPDPPATALVAPKGPPVQRTEELAPKSVTEPKPGWFVFDLGQNMVGWARLRVKGKAGTRVRLRFAETLNPDGTLYTVNLRSARSTDSYVLSGAPEGEVFEPHFTFHGFRYVEVRGYPGRPPAGAITGVVVHSVMPRTGSLETSSPLLNRLLANVDWGQRGNFVSIPTDCPQRDERLGWMGDAQIFARTACFDRDVAGFFAKWLQDVEDAQSAEGGFPDVAPRIVDLEDGAPAWGDAGVIVPWTVYQCYGDTAVLERHFDAMKKWVHYVRAANPNHIWRRRTNNNYGDWVAVNSTTPKDVLATAFYARSVQLVAEVARVLGREEDAREHDGLFKAIRAAFENEFVTDGGRITGDNQTVYALALRFDLLSEEKRGAAARHLAEAVERASGHLTTGFLGVAHLLPALSEAGRDDVAYRLLMNETYPSWGYSLKQGATTIWERWDGWTSEKGFQDPGMNSFNHYSFGSVGEWMQSVIGGLATDPRQPGYKHALVRPRPGGGLRFARASLQSVHGRYATEWTVDEARLTLAVTVPANASATVFVPGVGEGSRVSEGGKPPEQAEGVHLVRHDPGVAVYEVGSGAYRFVVEGYQPRTEP